MVNKRLDHCENKQPEKNQKDRKYNLVHMWLGPQTAILPCVAWGSPSKRCPHPGKVGELKPPRYRKKDVVS